MDEAANLLRPIAAIRSELSAPLRRITVLGAAKTGKTSLLNALLGAPVLPVLAYRSLSAVTVIEYGTTSAATVSRATAGVEEVPLGALRSLADDLDDGPAVTDIHLTVPLPLLANGAVLVDTPGLLESEVMDEIAYGELFRTDLAMVVLAADKILSAGERVAASRANDLLYGNVIFVVNRLDLVDEDERGDVIEWARSALRQSGNDLVGRARVFAVSAAPREAGSDGPGMAELTHWLAEFLQSELSSRAALLSRLGILDNHLREAAVRIRLELDNAVSREADARRRHDERVQRERAAMRASVAEGRLRVQSVQQRLPARGEDFVAQCRSGARRHLTAGPAGASAVREQFGGAVDSYAETMRDDVASALAGVPVTPPPFDLGSWIVREPIAPVNDPARELGVTVGDALTRIIDGGSFGREAGAAVGGWIGKNILGVDAEAETLKRIEGVARGTLQSIEAEAQSYLRTVLELLDEADAYYSVWTSTSREVEDAESARRYWSAVLRWCDEFVEAVKTAVREIAVTRQT
ncbi:MAG TPA: dynamin family protein [Chloroflexota bacterium]